MTDVGVIAAVIASIKGAAESVKLIRESGATLQAAELRANLVDVLERLSDARTNALDVQERLAKKDAKIAELEDALKAKDALRRMGAAYYRLGASDEAEGEPLCPRCWDVDHKQYQMIREPDLGHIMKCLVCKAMVEASAAPRRDPRK